MRLPEPYELYEKYSTRLETEQEALLKELQVCAYGDHPILEDFYYLINDEAICSRCLDNHFRIEVYS